MEAAKKRIILYCRNSTLQQEYFFQINSLESYYNTRNDVDIIETIGEKISGFKSETDRPEMNRLLKMVDDGLVDEIGVNSFDRLSRAAINLQTICLHCANKGVNIFFKSQNLNTLDEFGNFNPIVKLIISILSQFAEMDANNLKIKLVQGKTNKTKLNQYVGGTLPFGYTYVNDLENKSKKIIINEVEKKTVEFIFNSFVNENKTLNRIANDLNNFKESDKQYSQSKATKNTKFNMWHISVIRNILTCSWYAQGFRIWKDEKIILTDDLIYIEMDLFNKAQELLKENITKLKPSLHHYILNEKLVCSCGEKMRPKTSGKLNSYMCSNILKRAINKNLTCPEGKSISIEKVENAVWLMIKNKLPEFRIELEKKENKATEINAKIEVNNQLIYSINNTTIENLKNERKRNLNTFNKFGGDENELEKSINGIDNQIKQQEKIISEIKTINSKLLYSVENLDVANEIQNNLNIIEADKNLIKFYVNKLVSRITVQGGLNGKWDTVLKVKFNENINDDNEMYLFFNSLVKNPLYYFISAERKNININWSTDKVCFVISDSDLNESVELSIKQLTSMLNKYHENWIQEIFSENVLYDLPLIREYENIKELSTPFNINHRYFDDSSYIPTEQDKFQAKILELENKRKINYKYKINVGVGRLDIVTPFV